MDLTTKYMGLTLPSPLIVSSSGITNSAENVELCARNGAGAVVLKSLFEEQMVSDIHKLQKQDEMFFWYPEAVDYINKFSKEEGTDAYLKLIRNCKKAVDIPVIASINCTTPGEWPAFAHNIQEAGADGLELNIYLPPLESDVSCNQIEDTYVLIINEVLKNVTIPVAIKTGYYFTNPVQMLTHLSHTGISGMVLFNRFFSPDIDIDHFDVAGNNIYSAEEEMLQSLRWIALLSNKVSCDLSASTGIHTHTGVIKELLVGATTTQLCSTLYQNGIEYLSDIRQGLTDWMKKHRFNKIEDFRGLVTKYEQHTGAFERLQFMKKAVGDF